MAPDFLIVGAGMSGAALAARLSSFGRVLVLEQGDEPAGEAASQNAGLIRRLDAEPCDRALANRTYRFLVDEIPEWGLGDPSTKTGAIVGLVRDPLWLNNARAHLDANGILVHAINPSSVAVLKGSPVQHAWYLPEERICDGPRLAKAMLARAKERGAVVLCQQQVCSLIMNDGRVTGVQTTNETYTAGHVILAGGAWTQRIAATAGVNRPLYVLQRTAGWVSAELEPTNTQPWVWLDDVGVYIKPDPKGWLVSPCNETLVDAPEHSGSTGTPSTTEWALTEEKLNRFFPALGHTQKVGTWTGLRTFTPDRRPLLGADPSAPGLWWASGLGGSGVSTCWGVAEAIGEWIRGYETPWIDPKTVAPDRHQLRRWAIYPTGDPGKARLIEG